MVEPMRADRVALIRDRLAAGLPVDPGDVVALCDSHERLRAELVSVLKTLVAVSGQYVSVLDKVADHLKTNPRG